MALEEKGLSKEEALKRIFLIDSKGLIVKVSNYYSKRTSLLLCAESYEFD